MKKAILGLLLALPGILGTTQAQVIGDFEGSLDPGWVVIAGTGAISSDWASLGTSSLKVTPSAAGFAWALQFNNLSIMQQLVSTHYLRFDVHWESAQWLPDAGSDGWVRWDIASVNSGGAMGWKQITNADIDDPANPSYPGSWDPSNWGASHTRTLTYDLTSLGYDLSNPGWGAQFNLSYNFGNVENIGGYYIDNVRLVAVPEPGALAFLGLGGVLLAMRRRLVG